MSLNERQTEMRARLVKARCNRKLSIADEAKAGVLRSEGWTLQQIGDLFHMSRVGVLYVLRRASA